MAAKEGLINTGGLELKSKQETIDRSGYGQEQNETVNSLIQESTKTSTQNQKSRTDRDLNSTSSMAKMSATKSHIAFTLKFKITIQNRTPFNPNLSC